MRFILQILVFLVLFYFLRLILRALLPNSASQPTFENTGSRTQSRRRSVKQGKMEKDPVCGTYVDVASSVQETFGGQTKYFCSSNCLNIYKQTYYHERNTKSV
jgi:YHS domain-containing protein